MKNFKLKNILSAKSVYLVSRSNNEAYSFFKNEYHNLPEVNDSIIVPKEEIEDRIVEKKISLGSRIKRSFTGSKTIYIAPGTPLHSYISAEYKDYYMSDSTNGYYIEEPKKIKKR